MLNMTKIAAIVLAATLSLTTTAGAVIITDTVESHSDYTYVTSPSPGTRVSPLWGVTAQAGANFVSISQAGTTAAAGSITFTSGFGAGNTVQPGTYVFTMLAGDSDFDPDRLGFSTFSTRLETLGGTTLPGYVVTTPYVDPGNPSSADWVTTTVTHTVGFGDPLIGQQFRWTADWTKDASAFPFLGVFDDVSVEFTETVIPEPSSLLLLGLGALAMVRHTRRRRRSQGNNQQA